MKRSKRDNSKGRPKQKYFKHKGPRVKDTLAGLDVRPSKQRGQNFIIDPGVLLQIASFGNPQPGEKIVEIGPGLGALTEILRPNGNLTVIEIESKFCQQLAKRFPDITIIEKDVRLVDFSEIGTDLVVFGNLPYGFSTDIIFHLMAFSGCIRRAVLILQREFAARVGAAPGGKTYGVLSVSVQLTADVRLGPVIPGDAFRPPTEVESQLLELTFPQTPKFTIDDPLWVRRVVSAAFVMRRKMIKNSLRASGIAPGDKLDHALEIAKIEPQRRPETVSIQEFIALAGALKEG